MTLNSSSGAAILRPEDIQALVIQPLITSSVAMQVSTVVQTGSHSTRFPIVVSDPDSAWVAEGAEIPVSDPDVDELDVIPSGLKGLVVAVMSWSLTVTPPHSISWARGLLGICAPS
ncbi:phage major capsid protein [Mycolicibacterium fortuitum]|uniref:phage major capsid protein n=1 Tax=Mycolicibacterium fortuitum TaxID=1766 RepID=UPI0009BCEFD4|nr:phage major capsid protein [Mycolicibacterium fortuitum]